MMSWSSVEGFTKLHSLDTSFKKFYKDHIDIMI